MPAPHEHMAQQERPTFAASRTGMHACMHASHGPRPLQGYGLIFLRICKGLHVMRGRCSKHVLTCRSGMVLLPFWSLSQNSTALPRAKRLVPRLRALPAREGQAALLGAQLHAGRVGAAQAIPLRMCRPHCFECSQRNRHNQQIFFSLAQAITLNRKAPMACSVYNTGMRAAVPRPLRWR